MRYAGFRPSFSQVAQAASTRARCFRNSWLVSNHAIARGQRVRRASWATEIVRRPAASVSETGSRAESIAETSLSASGVGATSSGAARRRIGTAVSPIGLEVHERGKNRVDRLVHSGAGSHTRYGVGQLRRSRPRSRGMPDNPRNAAGHRREPSGVCRVPRVRIPATEEPADRLRQRREALRRGLAWFRARQSHFIMRSRETRSRTDRDRLRDVRRPKTPPGAQSPRTVQGFPDSRIPRRAPRSAPFHPW